MFMRSWARVFSAFAALFLLAACLNYADYSLQAYTNATELKAKSLSLLEKAGEPYSRHHAAAEKLMLDIDVAYEFSAGTKNNREAAKMWNIIRDPDENLMGGFVAFWRGPGARGMSPGFLREFRKDVSFGFDRLICLEANKRTAVSCPAIP